MSEERSRHNTVLTSFQVERQDPTPEEHERLVQALQAEKDQERQAKADLEAQKAESAQKWQLPWPPQRQEKHWGRISRQLQHKRNLYNLIDDIVAGKEEEPVQHPEDTLPLRQQTPVNLCTGGD